MVFNRLKKKRYQNLEYIWEHDHVYLSYKFVLGNYVTIDYNLFWHIIKYLSITTIERHSEIRHIFGKWRGEIEERISRGSHHRGRIIEACLQICVRKRLFPRGNTWYSKRGIRRSIVNVPQICVNYIGYLVCHNFKLWLRPKCSSLNFCTRLRTCLWVDFGRAT